MIVFLFLVAISTAATDLDLVCFGEQRMFCLEWIHNAVDPHKLNNTEFSEWVFGCTLYMDVHHCAFEPDLCELCAVAFCDANCSLEKDPTNCVLWCSSHIQNHLDDCKVHVEGKTEI